MAWKETPGNCKDAATGEIIIPVDSLIQNCLERQNTKEKLVLLEEDATGVGDRKTLLVRLLVELTRQNIWGTQSARVNEVIIDRPVV